MDATESGERTMPALFDRSRLNNDPLEQLTKAYFGSIPDVFRRPNNEFYTWLEQEITDRGVRGIILHRYVWCDIWHGELARLKERTNLPVLDLDWGDGEDCTNNYVSGRLQAFMETLS